MRFLLRGLLGVDSPRAALRLVPGAGLALGIMLVSLPLADALGAWLLRLRGLDPAGKVSPISGVPVAIVLGMLLGNLVRLPEALRPGIGFSLTKLLRLGIVCVGIKLSLLDVLRLGAWGIPIVVCAILSGLLFVTWLSRKLGLPDRLGTLIAAGTGICGVTAIVSTAPLIEAEDREVAYAVATITLFGLMAMLTYPYLAPRLLHTPEEIGLFFGTAIHDTSQVIGAALTYKAAFNDDVAFRAATVTKLTRNLFLALVVPGISFRYLRRRGQGGTAAAAPVRKLPLGKLFPVFILGFMAMALVRSLGDATAGRGLAFGLWSPGEWKDLTQRIGEVWGSRYLLGTALAGVGLGTRFAAFRGVGVRPFVVGLAGALLVGAVGLLLASTLGRFVHL